MPLHPGRGRGRGASERQLRGIEDLVVDTITKGDLDITKEDLSAITLWVNEKVTAATTCGTAASPFTTVSEDECCKLFCLAQLALRGSSPTLAQHVGRKTREVYMDLRASLFEALTRGALEELKLDIGRIKELMRGRLEELARGRLEELARGRLEELTAGRLEELTAGRLEELAAGRLEELAAGRLEVARDRLEELARGGVDEVARGVVEELACGVIEELARGVIEDLTHSVVEDMKRGLGEVVKRGMEEVKRGLVEEVKRSLLEEVKRSLVEDPARGRRVHALAGAVLATHTLRTYSRLLADSSAALQRHADEEKAAAALGLMGEVLSLLTVFGHLLNEYCPLGLTAPATPSDAYTLPELVLLECIYSGVLDHWASCWLRLASSETTMQPAMMSLLGVFTATGTRLANAVSSQLSKLGLCQDQMYFLMSIGGSHLQYLRLHVATSLAAALDGGSTYHDGEGVPAPTLPLYDTQEADGELGVPVASGAATNTTKWCLHTRRLWYCHQSAVECVHEQEQTARAQRRRDANAGRALEPRAARTFRFKDEQPEARCWTSPAGCRPRPPRVARVLRDLPALYDMVSVLHMPPRAHAHLSLRVAGAAMFPEEALSKVQPTQAEAGGAAGRIAFAADDRVSVAVYGMLSCREALSSCLLGAGLGPLPRRVVAMMKEWWRLCVELMRRHLADPLYKETPTMDLICDLQAPVFIGMPAFAAPDVAAALAAGLLPVYGRWVRAQPKDADTSTYMLPDHVVAQLLAFGQPDDVADLLHEVAHLVQADASHSTAISAALGLTTPHAIAWLAPGVNGSRLLPPSGGAVQHVMPPAPATPEALARFGRVLAGVLVGMAPVLSAAALRARGGSGVCSERRAALLHGNSLAWATLGFAAELLWRMKDQVVTTQLGPWGGVLWYRVRVLDLMGSAVQLLIETSDEVVVAAVRERLRSCLRAAAAAWPLSLQQLLGGGALSLTRLRPLLKPGGRLADGQLLAELEELVRGTTVVQPPVLELAAAARLGNMEEALQAWQAAAARRSREP